MSLKKRALNFLSRREHSVAELKRKLSPKANEEELEGLMQVLIGEDLVSDSRYAESFIRARANRGYGPLRIVQELTQQGIDQEMINQLLPQAECFWFEHLQAVWQKKYHDQWPDDPKSYAQQARFLSQRGFSADMIMKLFKR